MPFHVKSISMSLAVLCFFVIAVIGWLAGLTPFTCCKRAVLGAVVVYVISSMVVRIVNRILIDAMLKAQMKQQNGDVANRGY